MRFIMTDVSYTKMSVSQYFLIARCLYVHHVSTVSTAGVGNQEATDSQGETKEMLQNQLRTIEEDLDVGTPCQN